MTKGTVMGNKMGSDSVYVGLSRTALLTEPITYTILILYTRVPS
jgi:hypothetical protein